MSGFISRPIPQTRCNHFFTFSARKNRHLRIAFSTPKVKDPKYVIAGQTRIRLEIKSGIIKKNSKLTMCNSNEVNPNQNYDASLPSVGAINSIDTSATSIFRNLYIIPTKAC